jgi:hypothetical protein
MTVSVMNNCRREILLQFVSDIPKQCFRWSSEISEVFQQVEPSFECAPSLVCKTVVHVVDTVGLGCAAQQHVRF